MQKSTFSVNFFIRPPQRRGLPSGLRQTITDLHTASKRELARGSRFCFNLNALFFLKIYDYSKIFHIFMTNYCE